MKHYNSHKLILIAGLLRRDHSDCLYLLPQDFSSTISHQNVKIIEEY